MSGWSALIGRIPIFLILAFILGYFQYNGLGGGLAIILLDILLGFASLLGIIPIAGVVLYWIVAETLIIPFVFDFTGIAASWVIDLFLWLNLIVSVIFTTVALLCLIAYTID